MAGGYGRGAGIPLKDRVRVDQPTEPAQQPMSAAGSEHPGRHCWVSVPVDASHPRIGDPLARMLIAGEVADGGAVNVDLADGALTLTITP